ncbi:MAG: hypothetical protein IKI38_00655, partial [Mogibacterium sp.]|nr:hypothetical protein [Mogibacterium sp.]
EEVAEEPAEVAEEPEEVAEEPAEVAEEPEEVAEEPEEVAEEPAEEPAPQSIDDFLAAILREGAASDDEPVSSVSGLVFDEPEAVSEEVEAVAEEVAEEPTVELEPALVVDEAEAVVEEAEAVAEEVAEEEPVAAVEEAVEAVEEEVVTPEDLGLEVPEFKEEPAAEEEEVAEETAEPEPEVVEEVSAAETAPEKETDALSIEELEQDLFGTVSSGEVEKEATKKIDKFYTLYRKNEEFQRLLDEEYNKLKAAGGPAPEPALPDSEPVEVKKSNKQIEDATIYQDFDLEKEAAKLKAEQEKAAAGEVDAKAVVGAVAATAATAAAVTAGGQTEESEIEYEEVDKGGGFLTVLAVIIAILLIVLLGVILVLNFMPDSAIALKIDSIIENITSHFTAVDVMGKRFLL